MRPVYEGYSAFSKYILNIGDPVFDTDNPKEVTPIKYANPTSQLVGISLNNVVDIDLSKKMLPLDSVIPGGLINIMTSGIVIAQLNPKWKLPMGQALYLNKLGRWTWRRTSLYAGTTMRKQDKDGFVEIKLKVNR